MASLPRLQRSLYPHLGGILSTIQPIAPRSVSTTALKHANSSLKPSTVTSRSGGVSAKEILSKTPRTTRVPPRSQPSQKPTTSDPLDPPEDAIRAAEAREMTLQAARLRRAKQRQEALEEQNKKEADKKDYQKRYNTAARKWVSSIIALPIFFVTSYYLIDRLALGNEQKILPKTEK